MNEESKALSVEELTALLPEGYALVEKEGWIPRQQAEEQIRAITFDREIDLELTRNGAKSLTAARALLNVEKLRENPEEMKGSVGKIRRENDWLFSHEPLMQSGMALQSHPSADTESMSDAEYYQYRKQRKGN